MTPSQYDTYSVRHLLRTTPSQDKDTEGHVTCVTFGYLYQSRRMGGISPEPELYKCNTIPILVNIAKIVLTSWISIYQPYLL